MLSAPTAAGVEIRAPAKVNLFLEVLGKRPDGYHEIATLMAAVSLYDVLDFQHDASGQVHLTCNDPALDTGPSNLVCKAAAVLRQHTGTTLGAAVRLTKRIPMAAGLAGGSDASVREGPSPSAASERTWSLLETLGERNFWCIALGTGLLMASDGAVLVSKFPYLLELGIEAQAASFLIGCMTASSVAGKIGIGLAADRVDLRRLFALVAVCHVLLLGILIAKPGYGVLLVSLSLFGVGVGGVYPLLATLTAAAFGSASFGAVAGTMQLVLLPISIGLVTFIGASHDRTGDYTVAFQVFLALVLVASGFIALVRLPQKPAVRLARKLLLPHQPEVRP